jgi:hypothetical protein
MDDGWLTGPQPCFWPAEQMSRRAVHRPRHSAHQKESARTRVREREREREKRRESLNCFFFTK